MPKTHLHSRFRRDRRAFLRRSAAAGLALACVQPRAFAVPEGIEPREVTLLPREDGYVLTAEFSLEVSPLLEEALKAVPLFFLFEYAVQRRRWYWWDEEVGSGVITYKLTFNALTRQYRLALSSQGVNLATLNFGTLEEAVRFMARVRRERVLEPNALKAGERYRVTVRLRLDVGQLPKPFQLNALTQREWLLDSDYKAIIVRGESK